METIHIVDRTLFQFFHLGLQNEFFDWVMPLLRNKYIWFPLYIGILAFIATNFSWYRAYYYIVFIIFSVLITDFVSGNVLKKTFQRERPCWTEYSKIHVEERVTCSPSFSFPSAHAANHFGLALMLSILLFVGRRKIQFVFFSWAFVISFAQVYVGLHYPFDILAGSLLGVLLTWLCILLIRPILFRIDIWEGNSEQLST